MVWTNKEKRISAHRGDIYINFRQRKHGNCSKVSIAIKEGMKNILTQSPILKDINAWQESLKNTLKQIKK